MTRRRSAAGLLAVGTLCLALSAAPALVSPVAAADATPGSGFGSFALSASAPAVQFRQEEPKFCYGTPAAQNGCELVLPEAVSTLRNGPIGAGIAAVAWPGALLADAGSLLITASNGAAPDQARTLNDPVRAEARTSTGPDTVTYDQVPGTTMKAVAKDDGTSAEASISQTQATAVGTFGKTTGQSSVSLTGPAGAVAKAHSSVQDISLAGGVVHIGAVTSDVTATTDGKAAKVAGTTVATGITIAGIPVTIDGHGITVQGSGVPLAAATAAVNTAVSNLGMIVAMGAPTGKPQGSSVTYSAGSLVFLWKQTDGYRMTVTLGGANVSVDADPALDFNLPAVDLGSGAGAAGAPGGTAVLPATTPALSGGVPGPSLSGNVPPPSTSTGGVTAPVLAAARLRLPGGLSPWLVVLGVAGSGLVMAGLRRLPDTVLAASAAACPLEETA